MKKLEQLFAELGRELGEDYANRGLRFLSEPERTQRLKEALLGYIRIGDLWRSVRTAKLLERDLSRAELNMIRRICVDTGRWAGLRSVAEHQGRRITTTELRKIRRVCVDKGNCRDVASVAIAMNCDITIDELSRIISRCVKERRFNDALSMVVHIPMGGKRNAEINEILRACIKAGEYDNATEATALLERELVDKELRELLMASVNAGLYTYAQALARRLRGKLSFDALHMIFHVCMKEKRFEDARIVADVILLDS